MMVTVILSTYNGQAYLVEAVKSVLAQSYTDFEFTILDDGSTDTTVDILNELASNDTRLKISQNVINRGTGYSYSLLLTQAKGKYIAAIGQDDRWEAGFLANSVADLEKNSATSVAFTDVTIIDSNGRLKQNFSSPFLHEWASKLRHDDLMCALVKYNFLCAASAVFRRSLIDNWHTHGENDQLQDWNSWQHLILKGPFSFIQPKGISYRIHDNNLSIAANNPKQIQIEVLQTRISMISSKEFVNFIIQSNDPNDLFYRAMTAYSESMDVSNSNYYVLLLYALSSNEDYLRDLPAYQALMETLYIYLGAYQKANRYFIRHKGLSSCPPVFLKGLEKRFIFIWDGSKGITATSRHISIKRLGPFYLIKLITKKGEYPLLKLGTSMDSKSIERAVEYLLCRKNFPSLLKVLKFLGNNMIRRMRSKPKRK